jgi:hypothetical protein
MDEVHEVDDHRCDIPSSLPYRLHYEKNPDFKSRGKIYSGCGNVTHTQGRRTSESPIGMLGR